MRQQIATFAAGAMLSAAVFLGLWQPWEDNAAPVAAVPTQTATEAHDALCERHLDRVAQAPSEEIAGFLIGAAREDDCAPRIFR